MKSTITLTLLSILYMSMCTGCATVTPRQQVATVEQTISTLRIELIEARTNGWIADQDWANIKTLDNAITPLVNEWHACVMSGASYTSERAKALAIMRELNGYLQKAIKEQEE